MKYPHIASRIFNKPLMIHPNKLDAIISGLWKRFELPGHYDHSMISTSRGDKEVRGMSVAERIAHIDVFGVLAHRGGPKAESDYVIGYQEIIGDIEACTSDKSIEQTVLHIDSPGGETDGAFELADRIKELDQKKPISAIIDTYALSAAFLIASATRRVAITPSGFAGSIGVVTRHIDLSKMLERDGVTVTHIFAGAHKIDGNSFEPLSEEVKHRYQYEVDSLYTMFVRRISENRDMSISAVRKTEAATFNAKQALKRGLVDVILDPDVFISTLTSNNKYAIGNKSIIKPSGAASKANVISIEKSKGFNSEAKPMGSRLAEYLNEQIGNGEDRNDIIDDMAQEADIEPATVKQITDGTIECPPLVRLEGFSRALDVELSDIVAAAEEDGCNYDAQNSDDSSARADPPKSMIAARARRAERIRIKIIMACDEAKDRQQQAMAIALETDIEPGQAARLLAMAPKQENHPDNPLATAMSTLRNPDVGADFAARGDEDGNAAEAAEAAKVISLMGGKK